MNITYFDIFILLCVFLSLIYYYGKRKYSHFRDRGVKYIEPPLPFFGNNIKVLFQQEHIIDFINTIYNSYPDQKYIGLFELQKPLLYLRDLDLIKQIAVKDFDNFMNHSTVLQEDIDVLFGKSLVYLKGDKWRDMRATLSPAFTSSRMREMFELVEACARDVADHYIAQINQTGKDIIRIEVKDELSRFTNDVIATAAYGIKVNSFENKDNEFYRLGKSAMNFSGIHFIKVLGYLVIPKIMKLLKVPICSSEVTKFFREVVTNTMRYRDQNGILRYDMIHLLMQAKKGALTHDNETGEFFEAGYATAQESSLGKRIIEKKWSEDELVAQAFIFFVGGFETESTYLQFFFYEMVRNPDIQEKLQNEIDVFYRSSNGKLVYNDLQELKYLDMCISETLRMWPPALIIDRLCTKNYKMPPPSDTSNKTYQIKAGEVVWIPIYALHHDPKYFPNPKKFDPERFSDENKSSINPKAFMPFGIGPRNCIGSRFALMEAKVFIFHMLYKFDVVRTEKTKIPVIFDKSSFSLKSKGGMHLGLKPRRRRNI